MTARPGLAVVVAAALAFGCRPTVEESPPGVALYARYCASCHGTAARGDGPVAAALRSPPPDLTTLARQPHGFDDAGLIAVIDGRRLVAAHGPREMPVWGDQLRERGKSPDPEAAVRRKIDAIVAYLATLQTK